MITSFNLLIVLSVLFWKKIEGNKYELYTPDGRFVEYQPHFYVSFKPLTICRWILCVLIEVARNT